MDSGLSNESGVTGISVTAEIYFFLVGVIFYKFKGKVN